MQIKQVRSATITVTYGGKKFLIDPFFADKGAYPPIPYTLNETAFPLVDLPMPVDEIIKNVDAVIVTHLHEDHFDDAAKAALPKNIKMFAQNEKEAEEIRSAGFQNVEVLREDGTAFGDIKLTKTNGEHAKGDILKKYYQMMNACSDVCGVVFSAPNEKKLYIAGDTCWCDAVRETIGAHKPDIIVVAASDGRFKDGDAMIMNKEDVYEVYRAAPYAKIIANHFETVNACMLSRKELRQFVEAKGMNSAVFVPEDGEEYIF